LLLGLESQTVRSCRELDSRRGHSICPSVSCPDASAHFPTVPTVKCASTLAYICTGTSWLCYRTRWCHPHYEPGVTHHHNTRKASDVTAICESPQYKMSDPGRITPQWASTACYRDSSALFASCSYPMSAMLLYAWDSILCNHSAPITRTKCRSCLL
jgi:hypothetical protein